jgi:hypothetical protein
VSGVSASASSPIEVFVEPGDYDLGGSTLQLPSDLELVGAGEGVTTISDTDFSQPVVTAPDGDSLRDLTVTSTADNNTNSVKGVGATGAVTLQDVAVTVSLPATSTQDAQAVGGMNAATNITLDDDTVTATATATAFSAQAVGPFTNVPFAVTIRGGTYTATATSSAVGLNLSGPADVIAAVINVTATNAFAVSENAGSSTGTPTATATVQNSQLTGQPVANGGDTIDIAASQVSPNMTNTGGTLTCVDDWSPSYVMLTSSCTS